MNHTLTRWEPLRELEDLQNRLSSVFGRAPVRRSNGHEEITLPDWSPVADITEDDKEYVIQAELPDVPPDAVKVTVENGVLTISGDRKFDKEEKGKRYHRVERAYGSFVRAFTLPEGSDPEKVRAEFKDGMLLVHLPKSEKAKPKQIEVQVSSDKGSQSSKSQSQQTSHTQGSISQQGGTSGSQQQQQQQQRQSSARS